MKKTLAALFLLFPGILLAQEASVEITPFIGYRWGGELTENYWFEEDLDLEAENSFGLLVDIPLTNHFQLELLADHQSTEMLDVTYFSPRMIDVDITYYQVGVLWHWNVRRFRAFVASGLGFAEIDPHLMGATREEKFSGSIATGIKTQISKHIGLRLEARGFWANTGDGWDWEDCEEGDCWDEEWDWDGTDDLFQGQVSVGLIVSF